MFNFVKRHGVFASICALALVTSSLPATAGPVIRIASNSGGRIGDFIVRLHQYRSQGSLVQFSGSCDSACTLLLALPRSNTCITEGTAFRFHAPTAASTQTSLAAKRYMMSQYPGWVRSWINKKNGLTSRLITMDYTYARKFMRTCTEVASR